MKNLLIAIICLILLNSIGLLVPQVAVTEDFRDSVMESEASTAYCYESWIDYTKEACKNFDKLREEQKEARMVETQRQIASEALPAAGGRDEKPRDIPMGSPSK